MFRAGDVYTALADSWGLLGAWIHTRETRGQEELPKFFNLVLMFKSSWKICLCSITNQVLVFNYHWATKNKMQSSARCFERTWYGVFQDACHQKQKVLLLVHYSWCSLLWMERQWPYCLASGRQPFVCCSSAAKWIFKNLASELVLMN